MPSERRVIDCHGLGIAVTRTNEDGTRISIVSMSRPDRDLNGLFVPRANMIRLAHTLLRIAEEEDHDRA